MKPEPERTEKVEIVWIPYRIQREWGLWTHKRCRPYLPIAILFGLGTTADHGSRCRPPTWHPMQYGEARWAMSNLVSNLDHISPLLAVVVLHVMGNFATTLSSRISWWLVQMTKVLVHTMQFWCSIKIVPPCWMLEVFVGHEALAFNYDHQTS